MVAPKSFIKLTTVDKAMIAADPLAALIGYVSTILAVFGVFHWMGLDADQVAILGGAVLGLMATLRHFYEKSRRKAHEELQVAHEELKRKTGAHPQETPVKESGASEKP